MRNLEEMIELTEAITACIDVIQKPRKHGIKSLSFDYKNSEADIVGETLE